MTDTIRVLADLKKAGNRGVTCGSYGRGFRLGARIFDLRKQGEKIITQRIPNNHKPGYRAKYILFPDGENYEH